MLFHEGLFSALQDLHVLPTASSTTSQSPPSINYPRILDTRIPGGMHYHTILQRDMRNQFCWVIKVTYMVPIWVRNFLGFIYLTFMTFYELSHRPPNRTV